LSLILTPLEGIPEVRPGDDLAGMLLEAARGLLEPGGPPGGHPQGDQQG